MSKKSANTKPEEVEVVDVPKIKPPPAEGWLTSPGKIVPDLWKKNILSNPQMYLERSINQEYVKEVIVNHLVEEPNDPLFVHPMFDELREKAKVLSQELPITKKEGEPF